MHVSYFSHATSEYSTIIFGNILELISDINYIEHFGNYIYMHLAGCDFTYIFLVE